MGKCTVILLISLLHHVSADRIFPPFSNVRAIDGSDANEGGKAGGQLGRTSYADYPGDGSGSTMRSSPDLPNPRTLSNKCHKQKVESPNKRGLSDMVWAFGQFLEYVSRITREGQS